MEQRLVSINIVSFNGARYLKKCLESVRNQTYKNIEVNILDNDSQDDTLAIIKEVSKKINLPTTHYKLQTNVGFAKGHNILITKSSGAYMVMLNQDAWLDKNYVAIALEIFNRDATIAALQPKIYRYNFQTQSVVTKEGKRVLDTTGLVMLKNRRVIARGQGQVDEGQFEKEEEVFGADGAAPIFRRAALEDIKLPIPYSERSEKQGSATAGSYTLYPIPSCEYFDEDFFMYKEDVDLSWRLRLYGWKIFYTPSLIAYHERGSGESASTNYLDIIQERKHISRLAKSLSWRNQRLMQVKNEMFWAYVRNLPQILIKEIASFFYILFFEPYALSSIKEFFALLPRALKKRFLIMAHRKITARQFSQWLQ